MLKRLMAVLAVSGGLFAADQLTVHKVQLNGPSGTVNGKVVGVGEYLVFVNDDSPDKSFLVPRGDIRSARNDSGTLTIEMTRPVADREGTRSNLMIRLIDPAAAEPLTTWIGVPTETRARTVTYTVDVTQKMAVGEGHGKLVIEEGRLRYESLTDKSASQTWDYNDIRKFHWVKEHNLLQVEAGGKQLEFQVKGGLTDPVYQLVSQKIVRNR